MHDDIGMDLDNLHMTFVLSLSVIINFIPIYIGCTICLQGFTLLGNQSVEGSL